MSSGIPDEHELRTRVLEAGYGLKSPLFPLPQDVHDRVAEGETVKAVRTLRRHADGKLPLLAAKRMIDELSRHAR